MFNSDELTCCGPHKFTNFPAVVHPQAASIADSEYGLSSRQLDDLTRACDLLDGDVVAGDGPLPTYSEQQLDQIQRVRTKVKALITLTKNPEGNVSDVN